MKNLQSNEDYEKSVCECNGYKFHPRSFVCKRCGVVNDAIFTFIESNRSIQQRCSGCGAFICNVKYDPRSKSEKINDRIYKPDNDMKLDINATMKEIMGMKQQLGEFSLDLYYNDIEERKGTPYTAKLQWPSSDTEVNRYIHTYHEHHERAESFDVALMHTELFLKDIIRQGKRIYEI